MTQGLVSFQPSPGPGEQPESIAEVVTEILRAHRNHAGGGELDRQRDPVQSLADLCHCSGVGLAVRCERRVHCLSPFDEQLDRW